MRKLVFIFLLLAGTGSDLSAQYNNPHYYFEPYTTAAEGLFNNPRPGKAKVNFNFFGSPFRVKLELVSIKQMNYLPNLDSILTLAKSAVMQIADSLKEDAVNRKVDVLVVKRVPIQLRITNHSDRSATFFVQNDELVRLKTEQDTLRIKFMVFTGRQKNHKNEIIYRDTAPAFISIFVNDLSKLQELPADIMQSCLALLQQDITKEFVEKSSPYANYSASYNLMNQKRFSPSKPKWIKYGNYRKELVPNIYGSLQFVRGSLVPSMAAGLRFSLPRTSSHTTRFYLMWEPYFFFSKDAKNAIATNRNDFITFRYIEEDENDRKNGGFNFISNVSFGYLAGRRGEWFEKNTFKVGLPGVRSGWLQLEPELYFNNFVKNFSPTLKLTLHYE
jgi:hypothetical protein